MRRRVVITGVGLVCPLGSNVDEVWDALLRGVSAVRPLSVTNAATGTSLTIPAASVPDGALKPLPKGLAFVADKFSRLAVMASADALADAQLDVPNEQRDRIGASTGSCMNGILETEAGFEQIFVRQKRKVHPFTLIRTMPNGPAAYIANVFGLGGPALHYSTTCSSSSVAIGEAARSIRHGYADLMIAGGTETLLTYSAVNCWHSAGLLADLDDEPSQSCRPFDARRNGAVLGEGAAFVVLEDRDRAVRRGARIRGEILGYACSADAGHVTQPSVEGQASSMRAALGDSGSEPARIGYIHAHGTGTKRNDAVETAAIKAVFGPQAGRIPVSSSKSMVGHMIGAAGAFGVIACVQSLAAGYIPPTANLREADPECDLDYVPSVGRRQPGLQAAMVNAFGFGGTCASLIVGGSNA